MVKDAARRSPWWGRASEAGPGLLLTLAFAIAAFATWWALRGTWLTFSALLWAFIYSIVATNVWPGLSSRFAAGIELASSRLLRLAIALLGLTISAAVWLRMGGVGLGVVLLNLAFAFFFGSLFCRYVLRMKGAVSVLLGVGTCICGASAIAATGPALKAKAEEMGVSLAVITLFGLLAMFGYPILFQGPLGAWLGGSPLAYGMWAGMGVHETAQVVAAAAQVEGAVGIAMMAKSIRIFMIGPMVFASQLLFRRLEAGGREGAARLSIPWFAVAFVLFTLVSAAMEVSPAAAEWARFNGDYLKPAVTFLLAWAFVGVGFKVRASAIKAIGLKAFLGGMAVAVVAGVSALLLTRYLWLPFEV